MYDVILDSRKPQAKTFRKWVTSEILPSIRKHGIYATDNVIDQILNNPAKGYLRVSFHIRPVFKQYMVHRLVALAFIPNINNMPEINHKNGDKKDNRVSNLEWCTSKENLRHKFDVLNYKVSKDTREKISIAKKGKY